MRLLSWGPAGGERGAIMVRGEAVDLASALAKTGVLDPPATIDDLLARPDWRRLTERVLGFRVTEAERVAPGARVGPPVTRPSKVIVVGANTHSHVAEARARTQGRPPRQPMILAKAPTAICGPEDPIVKPRTTSKLDYEVELGVVIGARARHVEADSAGGVIAGYTVVNDVSARDVQLAEHEENEFYRTHYLGKSFDTFCPCGPHLVTADELPALERLMLRTWVNGELRQDGTVADLCCGVFELIAYLSSVMTLLPGDLICSGSPAGVAAFMSPPRYLSAGDVVECEVVGIGRLRNVVAAESV